MKESDEIVVRELNEMDISNKPDREFKVMVITLKKKSGGS